jgi:hypothetical protein
MGALMLLQKVRNYLPIDLTLRVQRQISQLPSLVMISTSHFPAELFLYTTALQADSDVTFSLNMRFVNLGSPYRNSFVSVTENWALLLLYCYSEEIR